MLYGTNVATLDVHQYDGQIANHDIKTRYTLETKNDIFKTLIHIINELAQDNVKSYGINGVNMIMKDAQSISNYDNTNNVYADDILMEICNLISILHEDKELITTLTNTLCEQFYDLYITNGFCAVGRVCRIYQIYRVMNDYFHEKNHD